MGIGTSQAVETTATILCVDDEKNILSALKRVFRPEGYRVLLASTGQEGLEVLKEESVDLVISDMRMPEMDGAEFLAKVAENWPQVTRILLTGYSELSATIEAINKGKIFKYISKPWSDYEIKLTVKQALEAAEIKRERDHLLQLTHQQNEELKSFNEELEVKVKNRTAELDQTMDMLNQSYETLKESYITTVSVFSNIVEMREGSLKGHSKRVSEQAHRLAIQMGMEEDDAQQVRFAGMLRGIGKLGFTDRMSTMSVATMDDDLKEKYYKHSAIGAGILSALEPLHSAAKYIHSYCERHDGKGFPDGIKGDEIPLGSRVLAVISDFDALQTGHLFKERLSENKAIDYIKDSKGTKYDPDTVDAFMRMQGDVADIELFDQGGLSVPASELENGMVISENLYTKDGILLLSEGYRLGDHMIEQIKILEKSLNETLEIMIVG